MMTHSERYAWMEGVLAHSELTDAQKLVMIRIALHLNFSSGRCDPGLRTIAAGCRMSERAVRMAVTRAEGLGLLRRDIGGGAGHTNAYRLAAPKTRNGGAGFSEVKPGTAVHETRNGGAEKRGTAVPPNSEENSEENRGSARDGFEGFWRAYPRREAKLAAEKTYRAVVQDGLATPEQLEAAAIQYAQAVTDRQPRYISLPANWLREQRWTDEPDTRARDARGAETDRLFAELPLDVQARALAKAGGPR
jgi:hypothetical protein